MARMRFSRDYRESVVLGNGCRLRFRLVRPKDAPLLVQIFEQLSPEARYQRFFAHKNALSPADLRTLTDCDGTNHLAIAAVADTGAGEEGVGVARFVRMREDPCAAEVALAVVDARRREGIGGKLVGRLSEAAAERGIRRLHYLVLADNLPMKGLMQKVAPHAARGDSRVHGAMISTFVVPLAASGRR